MKKIISIHQPNFCPYHGFFQKMDQSDFFVLLTECQFEKNGYQNRFNHENKWYTMSINQSLSPIKEKVYANPESDWKKIVTVFPVLNKLSVLPLNNMVLMNYQIIKDSAEILGIKTPISFDFPTEKKSTERLIEIVKNAGGTHYLSGLSGSKYMDMKLWELAEIDVIFQDEKTISKKSLIQIL